MKKKVLIFGITGQDGYYLCKILKNLNYKIYGATRSKKNIKNPFKKEFSNTIEVFKTDITNYNQVLKLISKIKPYFIFNLTNISSIKYSYDNPINTFESIFNGNLNILQSILKVDKKIKYFSASSSEIFGDNLKGEVNENTPFKPNNNYGMAKKNAFELVKYYRERFGIFCSSGILFNHESPIRGERYLPISLIDNCILINNKRKQKIKINNLISKCDWGWAPDYANAIFKCINYKKPDDFIIASGRTYSVLDLVKIVFNYFNLNYKSYIEVENTDRSTIRNTSNFKVNTSKIYKCLNWKTDKDLNEVVQNIIIARLRNDKKN